VTVRSASSARRWLHCGLSVALPQEPDNPGPSAIIGTRFHALLEVALNAGKWVELEPLDEHFEFALRSTLDWFNAKLPGDVTILTEQAYELKPLGGYVFEHGKREPKWKDEAICRALPPSTKHRDYPNVDGAIYGTADVVVIQKGSVHVYDWKTGQKSDDHEYQLRTLALMAALTYGVDQAAASAVYINLKSGKVSDTTKVYDAYDLHMHNCAIRESSHKLARKELPNPNPGKYCFFCPAIGCPEKLRTSR
jgi:ATP-dependent exoDNAse (exonuclease V) beta subunit